MPDLMDVLAPAGGARLKQGRVGAVVGVDSQYIHIDYAAGRILNAGKFDDATYVVGDYVWFLLDDEAGALILGKQTPGVHEDASPTPPAPLTVNSASNATYDTAAAVWTASTLVQSPTKLASWFYTAGAFSSVAGWALGSVELEVIRSTGGPLEVTPHGNTTGSGTYLAVDERHLWPSTPVGVATWVPLPLDWGARLATGVIKGFSIGGGTYSGTYAGTGRVRLTPI